MKLFGLVGFPLGHSWSPDYYNRRFLEEGLSEAVYRLFPVPSCLEIPRLIEANHSLAGFNVTIPYKEKITTLLDEADPMVGSTGSANLVLVDRTRKPVRLRGFNTDAPAFEATLPQPLGHSHALILGTGGSSRSVAYVLEKIGVKILFVSRHPGKPGSVTYDDLRTDPSLVGNHTLIVNTTPAGMFPDTGSAPDLPYGLLTPRHFLYDLVYNPEMTTFLHNGAAIGARTQSGKELFLEQASLSFSIFLRAC